MKKLIIKGAREHNLKNIDVELPRDRLIVISGLSGSGKSSLAFDTIYAEGQRRYVESLSAYARQFLGRLDKPDLDFIEGLSPAISVEQKTTHRNPRSTVGTVTEIYDYLRLLYAKIGVPHCPECGKPLEEQGVDQIVDNILAYPVGSPMMLLSPVVRDRKGEYQAVFEDALRAGFVRARIDGAVTPLDQDIVLDKRKKHTIEIVVDRIRVDPKSKKRIADSVERTIESGSGAVIVSVNGDNKFFSQEHGCPECGTSFPELSPQLFSFNSHQGACERCSGLGIILDFDPELVIPDKGRSFSQGAIKTFSPNSNWSRGIIDGLATEFNFKSSAPITEYPQQAVDALLFGTDKELSFTYTNSRGESQQLTRGFEGIINRLQRSYKRHGPHPWFRQFMQENDCPACAGRRLRPETASVLLEGRNISDVSKLSIGDCGEFFLRLDLSKTQKEIATEILKEIRNRLSFLTNVGLDYLTLERAASTLSGGEAQRIRLATQIGSSLVGVLYILDEPTIGLHQRDNKRLIDTLKHLRDIGNTVIVVEHDEQTLKTADYILDLGPGAGVHGGEIVAKGTVSQILRSSKSLTGRYLSGRISIPTPTERRSTAGSQLTIQGAREHNLKNIDVSFPLGTLCVITGVSGSGKSTLLSNILHPALANKLGRGSAREGASEGIIGWEHLDKVINIDQSPIGRTPRSNPATYVGLFTEIRRLFSRVPEARARGYKPGRFSFNVKAGRCLNCRGDGTIRIEMHFLSDVHITCDVCGGKRYNRETLEIFYRGKNIHDVLNMTVEEALDFFASIPVAKRILQTLFDVGLGYIQLGQSALTLSGGEAQRVKLAHELARPGTGRTIYILDEPTTGLHFEDVKKLIEVLQMLVEKGNTVVLIEHNLDVIKQADYIVDLGPEGGDRGGNVVAAGTPEHIMCCDTSYTGQYLRGVIAKNDNA
ncbi:MAG: excinuclease ABC subunit A [Spirochaetales bacterium]|nr:excinuclease ABC subunit A [Spirochaetales bacterium]